LPNSWEKIVSSISPAQRHRFLSDSPFFEVFTRSELDRLAARLIERRVADRQVIFGRGEPGSSMMAVVGTAGAEMGIQLDGKVNLMSRDFLRGG
jgi:hypothetical protein